MDQEQLLRMINVVLANSQRPSIAEIRSETRLRDELGLDSFMLAELTVRIEQATGVDVFGDGLVSTVADVLARLDND